jgi:ABC-2 type transport system ATP-binding protein
VAAAITGLARTGITVSEFALGQPSLDEVFLALTGHGGAVNHGTQETAS